ncbi:MAG: hypothetical protein U9Q67_05110 [Patescibacteria group bacterium]|nr:hypothetical protein [Patescibacteria group bacterium]
MSKLLKKILSAAMFPAALMIASKVAGMAMANRILGLGWSISTDTGGLFSVQVAYPDMASALACNSYSNLFMIVGIMLGTISTIFQGYFLHTSHQNPKVLVKLIRFDFVMWLTDSSVLFPKMAVWLAFLWTVTLVSLSQTIQNMTYPWISGFALISTVILTWLAVKDFEREIKTVMPEDSKLKLK